MANLHLRHPRYFALLAVLLFLVVIQLLFKPTDTLKNSRLFTSTAVTSSLKDVLDNEEARYRLALQDREGLVQRWGPTVQDVASYVWHILFILSSCLSTISFPKNGPMYTLCM